MSLFCFGFFISCGDEKFEPYVYRDDRSALLPSEITELDENEAPVRTWHLKYDILNRITSIRIDSVNGDGSMVNNITYHEGGNITTESIIFSGTEVQSYFKQECEFPDNVKKDQVLERIYNKNDTLLGTYTLNLKNERLITVKDVTDDVVYAYEYDSQENLISETYGSDSPYILSYDSSIGMMSNIKTPQWLFLSGMWREKPIMPKVLEYSFGNSFSLLEYSNDSTQSVFEYEYGVNPVYPSKVLRDEVPYLTIKYILGNIFLDKE
jgi:YD repeat-containing protein